jgi:hypothetical protein
MAEAVVKLASPYAQSIGGLNLYLFINAFGSDHISTPQMNDMAVFHSKDQRLQ